MGSSPRDGRFRITTGVTTALLVVAAALVLTNETPRCYERREFRDGRVEYREWVPEGGREGLHLGGSSGGDLVSEETGCTSDALLLPEAIAASALLLVALLWMSLRQTGNAAAKAGAAARFVLMLVTLLAFASVFSIGAFVAPLLIPLHWLAARRAGPWGRAGWTLLAATSAWLLGLALWLLAFGDAGAGGMTFAIAAAATCAALFFFGAHRRTSPT